MECGRLTTFPHPGPIPVGEGEIVRRVLEGWARYSPERVGMAPTVRLDGLTGVKRGTLSRREGVGVRGSVKEP